MSAAEYLSIPTRIQAIQWKGDNQADVWEWAGANNFYGPIPAEDDRPASPAQLWVKANESWLPLEPGEWIAKDSHGYYPIKDDVFQAKYREVDPL